MKFPRYWAREFAGKGSNWSCWRWSDESQEDAQQNASEAAKRLQEKVAAGGLPERYPYGGGERPMREEVLEEFLDADGNLEAAITRNHYGCSVLNAARMMFVDIDFKDPPPTRRTVRSGGGFFSRLFGGGEEPTEAAAEAHPEEAPALERLQSWIAGHGGAGARAYRTAAGLRYILTDRPWEPDGEAVTTLEQLGSDPLYIQLCRAQQCFRARTNPKPWRIGHYALNSTWPDRPASRGWLQKYEKLASAYATCSLVDQLGNPDIHPQLESLVHRHDLDCRVDSGFKLA